MIVKLLTEISFKGGCTGSSESTHVKMPYCWKSHAMAQYISSGVRPSTSQLQRLARIVLYSLGNK